MLRFFRTKLSGRKGETNTTQRQFIGLRRKSAMISFNTSESKIITNIVQKISPSLVSIANFVFNSPESINGLTPHFIQYLQNLPGIDPMIEQAIVKISSLAATNPDACIKQVSICFPQINADPKKNLTDSPLNIQSSWLASKECSQFLESHLEVSVQSRVRFALQFVSTRFLALFYEGFIDQSNKDLHRCLPEEERQWELVFNYFLSPLLNDIVESTKNHALSVQFANLKYLERIIYKYSLIYPSKSWVFIQLFFNNLSVEQDLMYQILFKLNAARSISIKNFEASHEELNAFVARLYKYIFNDFFKLFDQEPELEPSLAYYMTNLFTTIINIYTPAQRDQSTFFKKTLEVPKQYPKSLISYGIRIIAFIYDRNNPKIKSLVDLNQLMIDGAEFFDKPSKNIISIPQSFILNCFRMILSGKTFQPFCDEYRPSKDVKMEPQDLKILPHIIKFIVRPQANFSNCQDELANLLTQIALNHFESFFNQIIKNERFMNNNPSAIFRCSRLIMEEKFFSEDPDIAFDYQDFIFEISTYSAIFISEYTQTYLEDNEYLRESFQHTEEENSNEENKDDDNENGFDSETSTENPTENVGSHHSVNSNNDFYDNQNEDNPNKDVHNPNDENAKLTKRTVTHINSDKQVQKIYGMHTESLISKFCI